MGGIKNAGVQRSNTVERAQPSGGHCWDLLARAQHVPFGLYYRQKHKGANASIPILLGPESTVCGTCFATSSHEAPSVSLPTNLLRTGSFCLKWVLPTQLGVSLIHTIRVLTKLAETHQNAAKQHTFTDMDPTLQLFIPYYLFD